MSGCENYVFCISQINLIYFRNTLVPSDICFSVCFYKFLLSGFFDTLCQYISQEKIVGMVTGLGADILLNLFCLLSAINFRPLFIHINVEPVCMLLQQSLFVAGPYCLYKVVLFRKPFIT